MNNPPIQKLLKKAIKRIKIKKKKQKMKRKKTVFVKKNAEGRKRRSCETHATLESSYDIILKRR